MKTGATLAVSNDITTPEPIYLAGGTLVSTSGDNTLTNHIRLQGSSTLKVQQGSLTLNPSFGDAVIVESGSAALNTNLAVAGNGDLIVKAPINLQDGQTTTNLGDLIHTGLGVVRFQDTLFLDRLEAVGGGTLWMDQPEGSDVISGTQFSTISLSFQEES